MYGKPKEGARSSRSKRGKYKMDTAQIVIQGPEPLTIDPSASGRRQADLTEPEARLLTTEIRRTSVRLWLLVTEAHDRKAHIALGYQTWDDYARAELHMSPSRSYQLLDTGHVIREIAAAGVDVESMPQPTARVVARVKDRLPDVRKAARKAARAGESPDKALRELARQPVRLTVSPEIKLTPTGETADSGGGGGPGRGQGPVSCPACGGAGKVSRSVAPKLRAFMKSL